MSLLGAVVQLSHVAGERVHQPLLVHQHFCHLVHQQHVGQNDPGDRPYLQGTLTPHLGGVPEQEEQGRQERVSGQQEADDTLVKVDQLVDDHEGVVHHPGQHLLLLPTHAPLPTLLLLP